MLGKIPWMRWVCLLATPILLSPLILMQYSAAVRCGYVVLVMAVYWTLELLPLPVTSLLPVVLFPLLGIADTNTTAMIYMKGVQMMYLGSLMVALAVEESGLHRRLALKALTLAGTNPAFIMLGFMLPTAFLSMWISNAATAAMMVPILDAVLVELGLNKRENTMMMLAVAYSANIGGTGTIIGTPPNLILMGFLTAQYPDHDLNFGSWMGFAIPEVIINLTIVWLVLMAYFMGMTRTKEILFRRKSSLDPEVGLEEEKMELKVETVCKEVEEKEETKTEVGVSVENRVEAVIREKYESLGPASFHELCVLAIFSSLVIVWFFRKPGFLPGWAQFLQWRDSKDKVITIGSACPTILAVILLFVVPADPRKNPSGPTLLHWKCVQSKFPWGIILLMGGGFALAMGASKSCLTELVGSALSSLSSLPASLTMLLLCLLTSAISQIASNSATTSMLVPVVLALSHSLGLHPSYLALAVTLTASHAFMLPVSTPPNAIVHSAGSLTIKDMAGVGAILNILCICTTLLCIHTYGVPMFGLSSVPTWANVTILQSESC